MKELNDQELDLVQGGQKLDITSSLPLFKEGQNVKYKNKEYQVIRASAGKLTVNGGSEFVYSIANNNEFLVNIPEHELKETDASLTNDVQVKMNVF